jgi:hypothetical protein
VHTGGLDVAGLVGLVPRAVVGSDDGVDVQVAEEGKGVAAHVAVRVKLKRARVQLDRLSRDGVALCFLLLLWCRAVVPPTVQTRDVRARFDLNVCVQATAAVDVPRLAGAEARQNVVGLEEGENHRHQLGDVGDWVVVDVDVEMITDFLVR